MQGGNLNGHGKRQSKFDDVPIPRGFQSTLDGILMALQRNERDRFEDRPDFQDQIGFLAKLAWADAAGFQWPKPRDASPTQERTLWEYINRAKLKKSPAAWLTTAIRDDCDPDDWQGFLDAYPNPAHCQWLMHKLATEKSQV